MRIPLSYQVEAGVMYPRGYGFAWMEPLSGHAVAFPVPLNWIAAAIRTWWLQARFPAHLRDTLNGEGLQAGAFARGYVMGREVSRSYNAGWNDGRGMMVREYLHREELATRIGYDRGFQAGARAVNEAMEAEFAKMFGAVRVLAKDAPR